MSADERQAALGVIETIYRENGESLMRPRIGLAEQPLPGGAQAAIVREPGRGAEPILVVSTSNLTSATLSRLLPTMAHDIALNPEPKELRVLLLQVDNTLVDDMTDEPFASPEAKFELDPAALIRKAGKRRIRIRGGDPPAPEWS